MQWTRRARQPKTTNWCRLAGLWRRSPRKAEISPWPAGRCGRRLHNGRNDRRGHDHRRCNPGDQYSRRTTETHRASVCRLGPPKKAREVSAMSARCRVLPSKRVSFPISVSDVLGSMGIACVGGFRYPASMASVRQRTLRQRVAGWIAILAILLNTFAPAVSHALGGNASAPWLEICTGGNFTAAGAARLQGDAPAKPGTTAVQHCPYCVPHGASFEAPPVSSVLVAGSDIGPQWVATADAVAPARPVWRTAHSRGPPVL